MKRVAVILLFIMLMPLGYSISIKELISRYSFFSATPQMNITDYADSMIDGNNNGINDTLVIELTAKNTAGSFVFVVNLFDKSGTLTNETTKSLNSGANKINITFASILLAQNQFNYSIKVYNLSRSLKFRKDNIPTQNYFNYEEGFKILDIKDSKVDKTLRINVTVNSSINGTYPSTLFISYNNSVIFSKESKEITNSLNYILFNFGNETIKRTHYAGNFAVPSVKIGRKTIKINFTTASYDFRDFAVTSYISSFADGAAGAGGNKYGILQINASLNIAEADNYNVVLGLYDLFGNPVEKKNASYFLNAGTNSASIDINGSKLYEKKLNGPFIVKYAELYQNNILVDRINDAYSTGNYNFNDFGADLPDLKVQINISQGYHYGINNITVNITIKNEGPKPAFNIFSEFFDNKTFSRVNISNILNSGSQIVYQFDFTNISDFEISAIADSQNFVDEMDESNNAERIAVKLNKRPNLAGIGDIVINETDKIMVNLSAYDPNGDNLSFSINFSNFSQSDNTFSWNTTLNDSGDYTFMATVSDGYLNDTQLFKATILNLDKNDLDNDSIDDSIDNLIGTEKSVATSTINLTILVGNTSNLKQFFNRSLPVMFFDNSNKIAEFEFDFTNYRMNLTNAAIDKQLAASKKGSLLLRGIVPKQKKIMWVDRISISNDVCIKDEEIDAIVNISARCRSSNEFKLKCDGRVRQSYKCTYNSTVRKYKVEGLNHTGIVQI